MPQDTTRNLTLSPRRAFVVQFDADAQVDAGRITGRIEHVISRRAATFESLELLLAFIDQVLREGDASQVTDR